ncbi:MAG: recombinase family protein [Patescibacteria group bacterium]|nr:recombinase family protein [Patescibacteria group bacterium]
MGTTSTNEAPKIEYCLYARKSSEDDERQAMSIDSQIKEMTDLATKDGIVIKEVRKESHSAKISGKRPVFMGLLNDLREGRFTGILTWAPDRLSRNAGDLGMLVDLMDQGKLVQIRTYSQVFSNNPNEKFLLMILCSQAKLENDQKGLNVKRGIRAKCEMGFRPGMAPLGYFNRAFNGIKDVIIDPERGPIVTEAFQKVANNGTSGRTLKKWLIEKGFTNRSGSAISLSQIYLMLKNPFYYGEFEYPIGSGNWYKGSYKPLVTKELFDKVQKRLKVPAKSKWGEKQFTFKGLFKCASCGSSLVGEDRYRKRKYGEPRYHVYYHCSRQINYDCKESYITEEGLAKALFRYINFTYIAHPQILNLTQEIRGGIAEYKLIRDDVLLRQDINPDSKIIDVRDYAKHALANGDVEKKRQLIQLFNGQLYLHDRKVMSSRVKQTAE